MIVGIRNFASGAFERSDAMSTGKQAPNFALPNQEGKVAQLGDFLGRTIVLFAFPKAATSG